MVKNFKAFLEAKLNKSDFDKLKSGIRRTNILIDKIKNGVPIYIDGVETKIEWMKDLDGEFKKYSDINFNLEDLEITYFQKKHRFPYEKVFKDKEGRYFSLNQIDKTAEFGSSGPGKISKRIEILQSIFLDIYQNDSQNEIWNEDFPDNGELLEEFRERIEDLLEVWKESKSDNVKFNFNKDSINLVGLDKFWIKTLILPTNKIFKKISELNNNNKWTIYHNSYSESNSVHKTLQNIWSKLRTGYNFNKWCPADVWLIQSGRESQIIELLKSLDFTIDSDSIIEELNSIMNGLFDNGVLIPISLKKIISSDFSIIVNNEKGRDMPKFKITEIIIGDTSFELKGIGSRIKVQSEWGEEMRDRLLSIDSSNTGLLINVDAEVEGKSSRHGKISFNIIKEIIKSLNVDSSNILKSVDELKDNSEEELENLIVNLSKEIENMVKVKKVKTGFKISESKNKLISRYQSLLVIKSILSLGNLKDLAITKIMRYALSIETDRFITPRYLRVI